MRQITARFIGHSRTEGLQDGSCFLWLLKRAWNLEEAASILWNLWTLVVSTKNSLCLKWNLIVFTIVYSVLSGCNFGKGGLRWIQDVFITSVFVWVMPIQMMFPLRQQTFDSCSSFLFRHFVRVWTCWRPPPALQIQPYHDIHVGLNSGSDIVLQGMMKGVHWLTSLSWC